MIKKTRACIFKVLCYAVATALALSLSSCDVFWREENKNTTEPQTSTPTVSELPSKNKTVIIYARGMDDTNATQLLIDAFNSQSDTIYVKYQELPTDSESLYWAYTGALSSEQAEYDVIDFDLSWCAEFADKGYIVNIGPYINADGINTGEYYKSAIEAVTYGGAIWGMPRNISAGTLFYRRDILKAAPKTWDELISFCELSNYTSAEYGFVFTGKYSETLVCEAMELIHSYGGFLFDDNMAETCIIDSAESQKGLDKLYELYHAKFTNPDIDQMSYIDAYVNFTVGGAALMRNWSSVLNTGGVTETLQEDNFAYSQLPGGSTTGGSILTGNMVSINNSSKHKNEAWEFIKFIVGKEGQKIISMNSGRFPSLVSTIRDLELLEKYPKFGYTGLTQAVATAFPKPITPVYRQFSQIMLDELYLFLNDEQDAAATTYNIQSRMNSADGQQSEHEEIIAQ